MADHADTNPVLSCYGMTCELASVSGPLKILQDISFSIGTRRALGIVGESGAG